MQSTNPYLSQTYIKQWQDREQERRDSPQGRADFARQQARHDEAVNFWFPNR